MKTQLLLMCNNSLATIFYMHVIIVDSASSSSSSSKRPRIDQISAANLDADDPADDDVSDLFDDRSKLIFTANLKICQFEKKQNNIFNHMDSAGLIQMCRSQGYIFLDHSPSFN